MNPSQSDLNEIHEKTQADRSAVYYLAYPGFDQLILTASVGRKERGERYWRPHFAEVDAVARLRETRTPTIFAGENIAEPGETIVAVPIANGDAVIGAIVHCYENGVKDELDVLRRLAQEKSKELFYGWVEFLVAEQSKPLSVLLNIAGSISSSLDLDRVLLSVVEQATRLFRAKMSSLMLVDDKKRELEMITAYGCSLDYLDKPNLPLDGSILGSVAKENKMRQVENIFLEPLYLHKDLAAREGVASLLAAPISFQKKVLGVLNIYSSQPRTWQQSERELLQTFADHAAIAINNARVHEQNLAMEDQLHASSKLATLGELAAGLAHEIRNPLAVINMLIHSWKASSPGQEDFEHDLNVIAQKISDLNALVADLLHLGSFRPLDRRPHNIEEMIDRVLRLLRHRINNQRAAVKKRIQTPHLTIPIDRERMEQVILNILLNALDVTPEGGSIEIKIATQKNAMTIDVADSGPGIPEAALPQLFKPFRTTKTKGTGLGLPISRRIVEEHKGEIRLTRNGPSGATFTIHMPLQIEE
ncbi:MAG: ATP-binding protein [Candidatus Omnitrophota bacterium]